MIFPCSRCGKDDFKKTCDRIVHLKRKFKCKLPSTPIPVPRFQLSLPALVVHVQGKD